MEKALLDTDSLSEILRSRSSPLAHRARSYLTEHDRFTISVVTVLEIVAGWRRLRREDRIDQFLRQLAGFDVLPLDTETATLAGRIEGDLARLGRRVGRADTMIAATAVRHALQLVTGNVGHYQRVRDVGFPLRIATWQREG